MSRPDCKEASEEPDYSLVKERVFFLPEHDGKKHSVDATAASLALPLGRFSSWVQTWPQNPSRWHYVVISISNKIKTIC